METKLFFMLFFMLFCESAGFTTFPIDHEIPVTLRKGTYC